MGRVPSGSSRARLQHPGFPEGRGNADPKGPIKAVANGLQDPDFIPALRYLLTAARAGAPLADLALARLFREGRGTRVNHVFAAVFARLAELQGDGRGSEILTRLQPSISEADRDQARQLIAAEMRSRGMRWPGARNAPRRSAAAGSSEPQFQSGR